MMRKTTRRLTYFLCVFAILSLASENADARRRRHHRKVQGKAQEELTEPELPIQAQPDAPVAIDRVDGNTVYLKATGSPTEGSTDPKPLVLDGLSDLQPIGVMRAAQGGKPYVLVRAKPCKECKQEPAIFIAQVGGSKVSRFVEPGRILDYRNRSTLMESRAFYGHCLSSKSGDVYLVFQKEKVDRKRQPQQSVVVIEPIVEAVEGGAMNDHLHETLIERHLPALSRTLHLVKGKVCREIESRNRVMASRPVDVSLKRQKATDQDDDDDDADAPRENQSDRDYDGNAPAKD
jgi:hypothetical protein